SGDKNLRRDVGRRDLRDDVEGRVDRGGAIEGDMAAGNLKGLAEEIEGPAERLERADNSWGVAAAGDVDAAAPFAVEPASANEDAARYGDLDIERCGDGGRTRLHRR